MSQSKMSATYSELTTNAQPQRTAVGEMVIVYHWCSSILHTDMNIGILQCRVLNKSDKTGWKPHK